VIATQSDIEAVLATQATTAMVISTKNRSLTTMCDLWEDDETRRS
jgi:hypothetical protein